MSKFTDRENAFENKFAHDEQLKFKIEARAAKLFGLWVADKIGLKDDAALSYAGDVIAANLEEAGYEDILRKVRGDLKAKNVQISDHVLDTEFRKKLDEAQKQIMDEVK